MSLEIWITLIVAALGGLCALLWQTNGNLDWISGALGVVVMLFAISLTCYNYGVEAGASKALDVFLKLRSPNIQRSLDYVHSARVDLTIIIATMFVSLFLMGLPYLLRSARNARR